MTPFNIREAVPDDAPGISAVKQATWPDEDADTGMIAQVIARPQHCTHIAIASAGIVGFVSAFMTQTAAGLPRWEVDLLAVHPAYRGQGIASHLVKTSATIGLQWGANLARALIHVENIASQRSFNRCGFIAEDNICGLYIADSKDQIAATAAPGMHCLEVHTLNYSGLWLEDVLSPADFAFARGLVTQRGLDLAGAVIVLHQQALIQAAEQAGFSLRGKYQWWIYAP